MKYYILQIVKHDDIGTIKNCKITTDYCKAKEWFNKKLKTQSYSHGYTTIEADGST